MVYNIPSCFWNLFIEHVRRQDELHRDRIAAHNIRHNMSASKSLMKWMSYDGAVRVWHDLPGDFDLWVDIDGKRYLDCGNHLFALVMVRTCPSLGTHYFNDETIGDVLEAFFGYAWRVRRGARPHGEFITTFVRQLELLCFAAWALGHYYDTSQWS